MVFFVYDGHDLWYVFFKGSVGRSRRFIPVCVDALNRFREGDFGVSQWDTMFCDLY